MKQEVILSKPRSDGILSKPRGDGVSTMAIEDGAFVDMVRKAMETHQRYLEKQCIDADLGHSVELPPFTPEQIAEFRETMKTADLSSVEWVPCEK